MKLFTNAVQLAQDRSGDGTFGSGASNSEASKFFLGDFSNLIHPAKGTLFDNIFTQVVGLVLTIAAIVAFFYLIFAGFQYITAGGDAAKAQAARTGIVNALVGVIVIIIAYSILKYAAQLFS